MTPKRKLLVGGTLVVAIMGLALGGTLSVFWKKGLSKGEISKKAKVLKSNGVVLECFRVLTEVDPLQPFGDRVRHYKDGSANCFRV